MLLIKGHRDFKVCKLVMVYCDPSIIVRVGIGGRRMGCGRGLQMVSELTCVVSVDVFLRS